MDIILGVAGTFSPPRYVKHTCDLSKHGIRPGLLRYVTNKVFLCLAKHASAILAFLLKLLECQFHTLAASTNYGTRMPLFACLDLIFRVLVNTEIQTIERG